MLICQNIFQDDYVILCSHQQCLTVPRQPSMWPCCSLWLLCKAVVMPRFRRNGTFLMAAGVEPFRCLLSTSWKTWVDAHLPCPAPLHVTASYWKGCIHAGPWMSFYELDGGPFLDIRVGLFSLCGLAFHFYECLKERSFWSFESFWSFGFLCCLCFLSFVSFVLKASAKPNFAKIFLLPVFGAL